MEPEQNRKILTNVEVIRYREFSGTISELSEALLSLQQEYVLLDERNKKLQQALDKFASNNTLKEE